MHRECYDAFEEEVSRHQALRCGIAAVFLSCALSQELTCRLDLCRGMAGAEVYACNWSGTVMVRKSATEQPVVVQGLRPREKILQV